MKLGYFTVPYCTYFTVPEHEHTYLFKNENAKSCKASKELMTVLCSAGMSDKKQKLLVIGKSNIPRCFKSVK